MRGVLELKWVALNLGCFFAAIYALHLNPDLEQGLVFLSGLFGFFVILSLQFYFDRRP